MLSASLLLGRSQPRAERCPVPWSIRPPGSDGHLGANLLVAIEGIILLYLCICLLPCSHLLWWLKLMHRGTIVSCSDISWYFQPKGGKPRVAVPWRAPAGVISMLSRAQPASVPARGTAALPPGSPSVAEAEAHPAELFFPD